MARGVKTFLIGSVFGKLTVTGLAGTNKWGSRLWVCRCACGAERLHNAYNLRKNNLFTCGQKGCYRKVEVRTNEHPDYPILVGMLARCSNKNAPNYHLYGGRGIKVCDRWRNGGFWVFIEDMGPRPTPKHSIDRIDNDGGYWCGCSECPECGPLGRTPNCRWATGKEQCRNKRTNKMLTYDGKTMTLQEWAECLGVKRNTIGERLRRGTPVEVALDARTYVKDRKFGPIPKFT